MRELSIMNLKYKKEEKIRRWEVISHLSTAKGR